MKNISKSSRYAELKAEKYLIDETNIQDFTDAFLLKNQQDGENSDFK